MGKFTKVLSFCQQKYNKNHIKVSLFVFVGKINEIYHIRQQGYCHCLIDEMSVVYTCCLTYCLYPLFYHSLKTYRCLYLLSYPVVYTCCFVYCIGFQDIKSCLFVFYHIFVPLHSGKRRVEAKRRTEDCPTQSEVFLDTPLGQEGYCRKGLWLWLKL